MVVGGVMRWAGLVTFFWIVGYFVALVAVLSAFVVAVLLGIRSFSGNASTLFKQSWLGLVNGLLVVIPFVAALVRVRS